LLSPSGDGHKAQRVEESGREMNAVDFYDLIVLNRIFTRIGEAAFEPVQMKPSWNRRKHIGRPRNRSPAEPRAQGVVCGGRDDGKRIENIAPA